MASQKLQAGVIGYGPAYNMGRRHLTEMREYAGFVPTAVCDTDPTRLEAAEQDFPGIETYADANRMLRASDVDIVAVVLPHNLHEQMATKCLNAGRHVVVEKPMACSVAECDRMIRAAKKNNVMLSVYHNRHWDGNIVAIMKHLRRIGRPYRWESFTGGYRKPRDWWRSERTVSGGTIFDWGAHFVEWMLQVMDSHMVEISGFQCKEVWMDHSIEDEVEAMVRFEGDGVGSHTESFVAMAEKPEIRVCGTRGAITASRSHVSLHTLDRARNRVTTQIALPAADHGAFYSNVGAHLRREKPLVITPEWARRVVQVLDYASRSARNGRAVKAKYP